MCEGGSRAARVDIAVCSKIGAGGGSRTLTGHWDPTDFKFPPPTLAGVGDDPYRLTWRHVGTCRHMWLVGKVLATEPLS